MAERSTSVSPSLSAKVISQATLSCRRRQGQSRPPQDGRHASASELLAHAGLGRDRRATSERQHGAAERVLEGHRERGVGAPGRRGSGRSTPAKSLPAVGRDQLIEAGGREAQGRSWQGQPSRRALQRARPTARTSIASAARSRISPSASLVAPGSPVSVTRPIDSHVPPRIPMPVPATTSRAR